MLTAALVSLVLAVKGNGTTTYESIGDRSFGVYLPSAYDVEDADYETFPMVLNLHGFIGSPEFRMNLMNDHAEQNDYIAVYPQGKSLGSIDVSSVDSFAGYCDYLDSIGEPCVINLTYWNDESWGSSPGPLGPTCSSDAVDVLIKHPFYNASRSAMPSECQDVLGCNLRDCTTDDVGFIENLLDEMETKFRVDTSRVYVTGYSNGAQMAQRLGCELPDRFAAIAPLHGQLALGFNCAPSSGESLPILNVWGTRDTNQPGLDIMSETGNYVTPVHQVMYLMGEYNGCDVDGEAYVSVTTTADGIRGWECVGYESCDFDVMSCSWNATHEEAFSWDFGLDVICSFFQKYSKPQLEQRGNGDGRKPAAVALIAVVFVLLLC